MTSKWLLFIAAGACFVGIPACEDNPEQLFRRAPPGAGDRWNDGKSAGVFDPNARNAFTDKFGAKSKQEICTGAEKAKRWAQMVAKPIIPLRSIAGLDLAGGESWTGLDFRDAEQGWTDAKGEQHEGLCQSNPTSGTADALGATWGDSSEVLVTYKLANNKLDFFQLNLGYRGHLTFKSRPTAYKDESKPNPRGIHEFDMVVGEQIKKDGRPWDLDWQDPGEMGDWATEIYDALNATFDPGATSSQGDCVAEAVCRAQATEDGGAAFGNRALGIYFSIASVLKGAALASTPEYFYGWYVKLLPFSAPAMFLKLDGEGPVATSKNLGDLNKTCEQKLGLTFGQFSETCLNINSKPELNAFNLGKLEGGMSHDKEAFDFSAEGVNLDFLSSRIGDDKVVGDDDKPLPEDKAHEFNMDIRAQGRNRNEYDVTDKIKTFQGTGNVYREFTKNVQNDVRKKMQEWADLRGPVAGGQCENGYKQVGQHCTKPNQAPRPPTQVDGGPLMCPEGYTLQPACKYEGFGIGDPACLGAANTWSTACTGFESVITPAPHEGTINPGVKKGSVGALAFKLGYKATVLAAGDPRLAFCSDPSPDITGADAGANCTKADGSGDNDVCWSKKCGEPDPNQENKRFCAAGTPPGFYKKCENGLLLETAFRRVLNVLGKGELLNLPPELRDRKYYFKQWAWALVKYLKAAPSFPLDMSAPAFSPGGDACVPPLPAGANPDEWKKQWFANCDPEPDHLLFDQIGDSGQLDKFEYIDRRFVSPTQDPLKLEYQIAISSSNQSEWMFHRKLTRAERALYRALQSDRSKPAASADDNVRITNIVGSPVLKAGWAAASPTKDAWYCASTLINGKPDEECPAGPPTDSRTGEFMLDDYGQPLLTNYRGAFTGTVFTIGTHYIKLDEALPFMKSARIGLPFFADPYKPVTEGATSATMTKLIVNWRPKTPGNGTRIPMNGQIDKFIPSATLSFSGSSLGFDIDYQDLDDGTVKIDGVQSDSYQGNLFLCQDKGGDLLSVEQYESMSTILDWLERHPSAKADCDILIRYSAFNSFPTVLAARQAGVVLVVGQGSGAGRITSVEIYDPSL